MPGVALVLARTGLADQGARRTQLRVGAAAGLATAAGMVVAVVDGILRSPAYLRSHASQLRTLGAVFVAAGLAAAGVAVRGRVGAIAGIASRARTRRAGLSLGAAVAVVALGAGLWFVRPHFRTDDPLLGDARQTAALQAREGEPVDGSRSYAEDSARWMVWYLGPVAGVAAVAGAAWLTRRAVVGRASPTQVLLLCAAAPPALLYLAKPSIFPDQPWAMRRFVPMVIPALLLAAGAAADALWSHRNSGRGHEANGPVRSRPPLLAGAAAALAVVIVVGTVVAPVVSAWPVRRFHAYDGNLGAVRELCAAMGPDAAVVVVPSASSLDRFLPPALRSVCRVPAVAGRRGDDAPSLDPRRVADLSARWRAAGRTLWLVADDPGRLDDRATVAFDRSWVSRFVLQETLTSRPSVYRETTLRLVAGPAVGTG